MRSRLLINLLLFFCVVTLAFFLFTTDGKPPPIPDTLLTDISPDSISTIRIERTGEVAIIFTKHDGEWQMSAPYQVRANQVRIDSMLGLLTTRSFARLDASAADLEPFGLEPPRLALWLDDHVFLFGNTENLDKRRYVRSGDTIQLVNDRLYPQLAAAATFFISPRLLPDNCRVESLQFPAHTIRKKDGNWIMEPAQETGPGFADSLIHAWQEASAITISPWAQGPGEGEIRIRLDDGAEQMFRIMSPLPKLVLARTDLGIQYHLDLETATRLLVPGNKEGENPSTKTFP